MTIKLSIIIPVYNASTTIERCVNSLNFFISHEIILINDGSTDESFAIMEKLKKENKDVKIINQKNMGVSSARNTGLREAKGEFVFFIDSDDYLRKSENIDNLILKNTFDILVFGYIEKNLDEVNINFLKKFEINVSDDYEYFMKKIFLDKKYRGAVWNKIYKRSLIVNGNIKFIGYDRVISEDFLFNLQLVIENKPLILIDNENITVHEWTDDSLSNQKRQINVIERTTESIKKICGLLDKESEKGYWLKNYYIIDYLLKFSILEIVTNDVSYSTFKKDLYKMINQTKSNFDVKKLTSIYQSPNGLLKNSYHFLLLIILKLKLFTILSRVLWYRYSKMYKK